MIKHRTLTVYIGDRLVGTLAETPDHLVAFEYSAAWLADGYSISPLSLPLERGVQLPKGYDPFNGLHGVFADSLPDGWGRLLVDRFLRQNGIDPGTLTEMTRLAIVGSAGMGALRYVPEETFALEIPASDLDALSQSCERILSSQETDDLDALFLLGGSSGGARPKANIEIDGQPWIVKFATGYDGEGIGAQEYAYAQCAAACGIRMAQTRLLPSTRCAGYYATRRFDRTPEGGRVHMISAGALLETSHRIPNLDYNILMQLTGVLTHDYTELEQLYRLMCYNVFAHNRDDHAKNFSYLYDETAGCWQLSPAYDLTYSSSIGGEHATTVDGNGRDPGMEDLLRVAAKAKLDLPWARSTADEIHQTVEDHLGPYLHPART